MRSGRATRQSGGFPTLVRITLCLPVGVFLSVAVGFDEVSFESVLSGFRDVFKGGVGCESVAYSGVGSSA